MKSLIKRIIATFGVVLLLATSIVLYLTFLVAWFNGNQILVTINSFGEAVIELIVIPIILVLGIYGLYFIFPKKVNNAV